MKYLFSFCLHVILKRNFMLFNLHYKIFWCTLGTSSMYSLLYVGKLGRKIALLCCYVRSLDCCMCYLLCDIIFLQYEVFQPNFIELRIQDKIGGGRVTGKEQSIILLSP